MARRKPVEPKPPTTAEQIERSYRHGFAQGAAQVVMAIERGVSCHALHEWVYRKLWTWRYKTAKLGLKVEMPPRTPS